MLGRVVSRRKIVEKQQVALEHKKQHPLVTCLKPQGWMQLLLCCLPRNTTNNLFQVIVLMLIFPASIKQLLSHACTNMQLHLILIYSSLPQ